MIVGMFLRNYKCYNNINIIPFVNRLGENMNVFIGPNGVGKSAVLESIHCLMNNVEPKDWPTTIGKKKDRTLITPIFVIKKQNALHHMREHFDAISDCFWSSDFTQLHLQEYSRAFNEFRDKLLQTINKDDYWLISIGKDSNGDIQLSPYDAKIRGKTKRFGVSADRVKAIYNWIMERYRYVYIPIENRISDILSLQAREMQDLMDSSVIDGIKGILGDKNYRHENKTISILDLVNKSLDEYVSGINGKMTDGYSFAVKGVRKKAIRPGDIVDAIVKEYFSIRRLTKDHKNIHELSSGQQRQALIDVAVTLLSTREKKSKQIILAIDEPESSLDTASKFKQVLKLFEISETYGRQLFITTHWYGMLLRPSQGSLHYVAETEQSPKISSYPMSYVFENRKNFPDSIEMKSYFDFVGSMISTLKQGNHQWLICEGYDDAVYLRSLLKGSLPNVIVLPFNGCGNVGKLYDFISIPMADEQEKRNIKGKVYCLVDNDTKCLVTRDNYSAARFGGRLRFERLLLDDASASGRTISVADPNANQTVIEDMLDPTCLWLSLMKLSEFSPELKCLLELYSLNEDVAYAGVSRSLAFLKKDSMEAHKKLPELAQYFSKLDFKAALAEEYCEMYAIMHGALTPDWMNSIVRHFNE